LKVEAWTIKAKTGTLKAEAKAWAFKAKDITNFARCFSTPGQMITMIF
jgi:hypothetical protein